MVQCVPENLKKTGKPGVEELDEGDISLIRWMLEFSPVERLRVAQDFVDGVARLRNGRQRRQ